MMPCGYAKMAAQQWLTVGYNTEGVQRTRQRAQDRGSEAAFAPILRRALT